ncbi:ATP-dependent RNA helicase DDX51 [Amphibalanus amphitrite]|uniref:ATP-dependent RNA helicase DDX51 n=1 Tax=Amphibalanus amphitrite TaxID=1232801 RepID=A0A6A4VXN7_AMPAM|nr:ATP-dependent RNA helicase DDX51 [Amphibalanus amphitrite]
MSLWTASGPSETLRNELMADPIGDRRPAPANLPALCPELRARLAAEGIEQVFLVQVTVLPELLAAAESPLPPADLCVSAPAGRGKTLPFVLPLVQARRRAAPAAGFTTRAELRESFNVVAPQPLKPLLMHNLLRQPDWRRSLVLVNWNEAAHQLELPLSVLGAREAEFPGAVPAGQRRRAPAEMLRLMAQAGKVDGRVRETPVPLYELRQYEATYVSGFPR